MNHFTPLPALLGGMLIGASACIMWLGLGRIAGISGILGGLASARGNDAGWRWAFLAGLILAPLGYEIFAGPVMVQGTIQGTTSSLTLIAGGLLVGFGTRLGGGCTSGHGVCGIARGAPRSFLATFLFTAAAMATVAARHLFER